MRKLNPWAILLMVPLFLVGCSMPESTEPNNKGGGHAHGPAPHKGVVIEWDPDEGSHAEFTVDHKTKTVTVYILGSNAKKAKMVKADKLILNIEDPELTLELKPKDAKDGKASEFVGTHEKLGVEKDFKGSVRGIIDGEPLEGDFEEEH